MDLITILVPMYNAEKFVGKTIKSILKQTYKNFELVLCDDGSTDSTYKVAKEFADSDSRIKLIQKQNEKNVSKTRNFLLNHISGKYVVWVDSDDRVNKRYLERLHTAITRTNADMAMCSFSLAKYNLFVGHSKAKTISGEEIFTRLFLNSSFMLWNKIYKAELVEGITFCEDLKIGEDFVFCLNYAKKCKSIAIIKDKLYNYIVRRGSVSHQKFSDRDFAFIKKLEELAKAEENEVIRNVIKSWLAFSSAMYTIYADKTKYANEIEHMRSLVDENKEYFLNEKKAKKEFIFLFKLRLATLGKNRKGE